jgi:hypothetical protein
MNTTNNSKRAAVREIKRAAAQAAFLAGTKPALPPRYETEMTQANEAARRATEAAKWAAEDAQVAK